MTLQGLIRALDDYWSAQGCAILQPYDVEVGAGTMHPDTTLRSLGPQPWNVAYTQPSRRPADGRYTRNPMRSQRYYQYQVLMKPSPADIVDIYIGSLKAIGFDTDAHDVRLVEDDWESPSLGASGVGWEVWLDGTEITQFTFFQQMGGIECDPVPVEITYGPERICLMLGGQLSFWDGLEWGGGLSYRDIEFEREMQNNVYNFEVADVEALRQLFDIYEKESARVLNTATRWDDETRALTASEGESGDAPMATALVAPALDLALKCSHIFNLLDARGAVGVAERAQYINRVRALVRKCCLRHMEQFRDAAAKR